VSTPKPQALDLNDVPGYDYNVDLAKKLLAEAGYPEGKGLPEITL